MMMIKDQHKSVESAEDYEENDNYGEILRAIAEKGPIFSDDEDNEYRQ